MSVLRPKIVVTHWVDSDVPSLLQRHGEVVANDSRESWPRAKLKEHARDADAILAFMPDRVDEDLLLDCRRLRIVAGALKGYDNIDVEACTRRGVWVTVVPDLLTEPTAELAIALLLSLIRNVGPGDRRVRSGEFAGWRPVFYGATLWGATVGVIGMGAVGRAITRRLAGLGSSIIYYDPCQPIEEEQQKPSAEPVPLDDLLQRADMIVVAAPLTDDSYHLLNEESLRLVKPSAYLVNVGRGSVVDEQAIAARLSAGSLGGYAADVFEMEDLSQANRPRQIPKSLLEQSDTTLFTPHLGSAVRAVRREIALEAARNITAVLAGDAPRHALNLPALRGE